MLLQSLFLYYFDGSDLVGVHVLGPDDLAECAATDYGLNVVEIVNWVGLFDAHEVALGYQVLSVFAYVLPGWAHNSNALILPSIIRCDYVLARQTITHIFL